MVHFEKEARLSLLSLLLLLVVIVCSVRPLMRDRSREERGVLAGVALGVVMATCVTMSSASIRNAKSTFCPVLALVSVYGRPFS